jgi:hypothetical protein
MSESLGMRIAFRMPESIRVLDNLEKEAMMKSFSRLENGFSAEASALAGEHRSARRALKGSKDDRAAWLEESESKVAGKRKHISHSP